MIHFSFFSDLEKEKGKSSKPQTKNYLSRKYKLFVFACYPSLIISSVVCKLIYINLRHDPVIDNTIMFQDNLLF